MKKNILIKTPFGTMVKVDRNDKNTYYLAIMQNGTIFHKLTSLREAEKVQPQRVIEWRLGIYDYDPIAHKQYKKFCFAQLKTFVLCKEDVVIYSEDSDRTDLKGCLMQEHVVKIMDGVSGAVKGHHGQRFWIGFNTNGSEYREDWTVKQFVSYEQAEQSDFPNVFYGEITVTYDYSNEMDVRLERCMPPRAIRDKNKYKKISRELVF